ncbi:hypothetical protein TNCT_192711 [Trichonephila clavata]|uniref:Uncharacterized protein n=1 Tax=Trichonephila clavata TaxID=2740835 RepID=A0A8X6M1V1_TRICU|nr:hypothetical protein TNCT_192711 [Trichonephila clavata]
MDTLFPLLVAALEVFNRYGLDDVHHTLLDVYLSPEMTSFEDIFQFRKKSEGLRSGEWRGCLLMSKILLWRGKCDMERCHYGTSICLQCLVSREGPFF